MEMKIYPEKDRHCLLSHLHCEAFHNIKTAMGGGIITSPTDKRHISIDLEFRKIWELNITCLKIKILCIFMKYTFTKHEQLCFSCD